MPARKVCGNRVLAGLAMRAAGLEARKWFSKVILILRRNSPIRVLILGLAVVSAGAMSRVLMAQSSSQGQTTQPKTPPKSEDNPFPGDQSQGAAQQKPAAGQSGASGQSNPGQDANKPAKKESDNPFPGEDVNAPVLPSGSGPGAAASDSGGGRAGGSNGAGNNGSGARRDSDGDPVRSPDPQGHYSDGQGGADEDDGFSSSLSGVNAAPRPDVDEEKAKANASAMPKENADEDVRVGQFYLDKKNWKAAQSRFAAAFAMSKENPDAVWGLAEAERHLGMYPEAQEHYKLFLTYDPTGPHGKAARKALEEVQARLNAGPSNKNSDNLPK